MLGMHRSGTSAITRTLHLLGAALPAGLIDADADNREGFFESQAIVDIHRRFFKAIGSGWDDPRPAPAVAYESEAARICRAEVAALLQQDFAQSSLFVVKDPRICKLLPIWRPALAEFGAQPLAVLAVRNPLEVALSLQERNDMPRSRALALWLDHMLEAEQGTRGMVRAFAAYERFIADPVAASETLWRRLGCFSEAETAAGLERIGAHWSPGLRHHSIGEDALPADPSVPEHVREAYRWLMTAASDGEPNLAPLDQIIREQARSLEVYGPWLAYQTAGERLPSFLDRLRRKVIR